MHLLHFFVFALIYFEGTLSSKTALPFSEKENPVVPVLTASKNGSLYLVQTSGNRSQLVKMNAASLEIEAKVELLDGLIFDTMDADGTLLVTGSMMNDTLCIWEIRSKGLTKTACRTLARVYAARLFPNFILVSDYYKVYLLNRTDLSNMTTITNEYGLIFQNGFTMLDDGSLVMPGVKGVLNVFSPTSNDLHFWEKTQTLNLPNKFDYVQTINVFSESGRMYFAVGYARYGIQILSSNMTLPVDLNRQPTVDLELVSSILTSNGQTPYQVEINIQNQLIIAYVDGYNGIIVSKLFNLSQFEVKRLPLGKFHRLICRNNKFAIINNTLFFPYDGNSVSRKSLSTINEELIPAEEIPPSQSWIRARSEMFPYTIIMMTASPDGQSIFVALKGGKISRLNTTSFEVMEDIKVDFEINLIDCIDDFLLVGHEADHLREICMFSIQDTGLNKTVCLQFECLNVARLFPEFILISDCVGVNLFNKSDLSWIGRIENPPSLTLLKNTITMLKDGSLILPGDSGNLIVFSRILENGVLVWNLTQTLILPIKHDTIISICIYYKAINNGKEEKVSLAVGYQYHGVQILELNSSSIIGKEGDTELNLQIVSNIPSMRSKAPSQIAVDPETQLVLANLGSSYGTIVAKVQTVPDHVGLRKVKLGDYVRMKGDDQESQFAVTSKAVFYISQGNYIFAKSLSWIKMELDQTVNLQHWESNSLILPDEYPQLSSLCAGLNSIFVGHSNGQLIKLNKTSLYIQERIQTNFTSDIDILQSNGDVILTGSQFESKISLWSLQIEGPFEIASKHIPKFKLAKLFHDFVLVEDLNNQLHFLNSTDLTTMTTINYTLGNSNWISTYVLLDDGSLICNGVKGTLNVYSRDESQTTWRLTQILNLPWNFNAKSIATFKDPKHGSTNLFAIAYEDRGGYIQILKPESKVGQNGEYKVELKHIDSFWGSTPLQMEVDQMNMLLIVHDTSDYEIKVYNLDLEVCLKMKLELKNGYNSKAKQQFAITDNTLYYVEEDIVVARSLPSIKQEPLIYT